MVKKIIAAIVLTLPLLGAQRGVQSAILSPAPVAASAPTYANNGCVATASSGLTTTCTVSGVGAGHTLAVACSGGSATLTDNGGSSISPAALTSGYGATFSVFALSGETSGSHVLVCTTGSTAQQIVATEATGGVLDVAGGAYGIATTQAGQSRTTSYSNEFVLTFGYSPATLTPGTTPIALTSTSYSSTNMFSAYGAVASPTTTNTSWTSTGGTTLILVVDVYLRP